MSSKIRIVIADDSSAVRSFLVQTLSTVSAIEVVGVAENGRDALEQISIHRPNVVVLDVEMPVMNGLETLKKLRQRDRVTPVIMFSSITVEGAEKTLEALSLGATECVAKPEGTHGIRQVTNYVHETVVPKLLFWGKHCAETRSRSVRPSVPQGRVNSPSQNHSSIDVVAIGASTGGPNALAEVISQVSREVDVPILIVQHIPAEFSRLLAERLDRISELTVKEAYDGAIPKPGSVWIAPGDRHIRVVKQGMSVAISVRDDAPVHSCRPSVDVLLRSIARTYKNRSMAVILTGMGKDGTNGCVEMSRNGAFVLAQDQASSVIWGMPWSVIEAGVADKVVPLSEVSREINRRATLGRHTAFVPRK